MGGDIYVKGCWSSQVIEGSWLHWLPKCYKQLELSIKVTSTNILLSICPTKRNLFVSSTQHIEWLLRRYEIFSYVINNPSNAQLINLTCVKCQNINLTYVLQRKPMNSKSLHEKIWLSQIYNPCAYLSHHHTMRNIYIYMDNTNPFM